MIIRRDEGLYRHLLRFETETGLPLTGSAHAAVWDVADSRESHIIRSGPVKPTDFICCKGMFIKYQILVCQAFVKKGLSDLNGLKPPLSATMRACLRGNEKFLLPKCLKMYPLPTKLPPYSWCQDCG